MAKNYTWVDTALQAKTTQVVETMVDIMQQNGGAWRASWISKIPYNRYNEIWSEVYGEVINDLGFELSPSSVIGEHALTLTNDEAIICRAETRKRLTGIRHTFDDITNSNFAGWLVTHYVSVTKHLSDFIAVDSDGAVSLADNYASAIEAVCTHTLPEIWRPLCDVLRDNEAAMCSLIDAVEPLYRINEWWKFAFVDGHFDLTTFGNVCISPR